MLPGFRFLFAAILLCTSILVFGLGAAALLRATHEQAANGPSWRTGPGQNFAQTPEPPVLAVLRVEPLPADAAPSLRDQVPTIGLPESEPEPAARLGSVPVPPADPQTFAPTGAVAEPPKPEPITFVPSDTPPAIAAPVAEQQAAASELRPADIAAAPVEASVTVGRVAALSDAPTPTIKDSSVKANADSKSDTKSDGNAASESKATKKRAQRAKKRRIVRRAPPPQQQTFDNPFGQQPTYAATAARTR